MYILILFGIILGGYFFVTSETGKNIISEIRDQTQNVSDFATNLVAKFESFSASAYKDIAGYLTIGYGHKIQPGENVPAQISEDDAKKLLASDMSTAAAVVDQYVTVPLTSNQRDALISFVFNTSSTDPAIFASSRLLAKLNSGDYYGAADEMLNWVHAGGSISNGLIARREQERNIFLS